MNAAMHRRGPTARANAKLAPAGGAVALSAPLAAGVEITQRQPSRSPSSGESHPAITGATRPPTCSATRQRTAAASAARPAVFLEQIPFYY